MEAIKTISLWWGIAALSIWASCTLVKWFMLY